MTMQLRALPYKDYSVLWTFAPIRPEVLDRVEEGLAQVLAHPGALALQHVAAGRTSAAFVADSVQRTEARLGTTEVMRYLQHATSAKRPVLILVSHERVTFAVNHAMFDGLALGELVAAVLTAATGAEPVLDERPPVRFALLAGLRSVGRSGLRPWRADRRASAVEAPLTPPGVGPGYSSLAEVPLDPELAARIAKVPTGGRATPAARLASVAVGALARVHRRDVDVPVAVPIALLRHVDNRRVVGNFIGVQPLGSLHASDWTPAGLTARLVTATKSGAAMIGLGYAVARAVRHVVLPKRPSAPGPGRVAVSGQMLRLPKIVPDAAWLGDDRTSYAATVGPWPSATVLVPLTMGDRSFISVWDETGDFDLEAFPEALLAELAEREADTALTSR